MLSDRLSGVGGRQREYSDALERARAWMRDAEPRANKLLSEPIAGDPKSVEDQLQNAKALNNEFVANGRLIDNAKQVCSIELGMGIVCGNINILCAFKILECSPEFYFIYMSLPYKLLKYK